MHLHFNVLYNSYSVVVIMIFIDEKSLHNQENSTLRSNRNMVLIYLFIYVFIYLSIYLFIHLIIFYQGSPFNVC